MAAFQNRIAGIPLNDEEKIQMPGELPETGRTGVLVFQKGDEAFSTIPFQVTNVTVYKGTRGLGVVDYKGNKMNLILSPAVDGIVPLTKSKTLGPLMGPGKNYLVSMRMNFVSMPKMAPVSESSDAFEKKAAAEFLDPFKLTISEANGRYIFRSKALAKYAGVGHPFDFNSLPGHEAAFLLSSWGLGQEKIATALNGLKDRISVEIHRLRWPSVPREMSKQASAEIAAMIKTMKPPMAELVKVATTLEDADSVDTVLSLGFINPENVARFMGAKDILRRSISALAKLLLAARLGLEDVNEDAVKSAMSHLERTVKGLGKVKMMAEGEEKKSSDQRKDAATRAFAAAL